MPAMSAASHLPEIGPPPGPNGDAPPPGPGSTITSAAPPPPAMPGAVHRPDPIPIEPDHAARRRARPASGTPPYGFGLAHRGRASAWSRRWPLLVSAVALLAIGISIGVLAERWRQEGAAAARRGQRHSEVSRTPTMIPDRMPQPLMPGRSGPRDVPAPVPEPVPDRVPDAVPDPDPAPDAVPDRVPDPSNPGSRFSQPPSAPGGGAGAFRTFTTALTESLCGKLSQCGLIDSATQSMCRAFAQELDPDDAADKVARGECSFNQRAADACLRAVADLRCDMGSSDRMMDWLMAPNRVGECAEAYVCR